MKVKHLEITKDMSIEDFMKQLEESGVLGAGRIAHATNLLADSMKDEDTKIFLSLAGPMIPGGLRKVVRDLIYHGYVDLIISSGANLTHDLVESFGGRHYISTGQDDETLQDNGMGRIADIYTKSDDFEIYGMIDSMNRFEFYCRYRPYLFHFIHELKDYFHFYISTLGHENYATKIIADLIKKAQI